jgi:hypothetical protein
VAKILPVNFTDYLWIKFVAILVAVAIFEFWKGLNGRK